jgi:hypothetical protein
MVRTLLLICLFPAVTLAQTIERTETTAVFRVDGKEIGMYHYGPKVAKPYLWPLLTPAGASVTRGWPQADNNPGDKTKDHPHHKSAWFCHGDVIPEDMSLKTRSSDKRVQGVDFWAETPGHGKIATTGAPSVDGATLTAQHDWNTPDGETILKEKRVLRIEKVGPGILIHMHSQLTANACPITFGDTKEGSFGIRIADTINEKDGKGTLSNAEGKTGEKAVWGYASTWCDYSGKTHDGKTAGLAIFDHPKNPTPASWHSRGYGLMAANPFGRDKSFPGQKGKTELVRLKMNESIDFRYAIYLHDGDAKTGKVQEAYEAFVK